MRDVIVKDEAFDADYKRVVILYAEDNKRTADKMKVFLKAQGYVVIYAENKEEAEAIIKEGTLFDIVVTDNYMPNKDDGIKLIELLRKTKGYEDIPAVLFSKSACLKHKELKRLAAKPFMKLWGKRRLSKFVEKMLLSGFYSQPTKSNEIIPLFVKCGEDGHEPTREEGRKARPCSSVDSRSPVRRDKRPVLRIRDGMDTATTDRSSANSKQITRAGPGRGQQSSPAREPGNTARFFPTLSPSENPAFIFINSIYKHIHKRIRAAIKNDGAHIFFAAKKEFSIGPLGGDDLSYRGRKGAGAYASRSATLMSGSSSPVENKKSLFP
ncbi:MAG: response regulator, partial [Candidatus Omnitrophica bacterium]|nr:response regulator [Candidatus Omnitrophota bacterium]